MKNIVLLIIDSMNYSHMLANPSLTPFINNLKENGLYFDNMFSQAPYTEAATMNIYCGQNVLDSGGYLRRFEKAKMTIFEAMKAKGFATYFNSLQPQCYPSSLRRGIDYCYYSVGFDISALWSYRLYYYAELFEKKQLTNSDYSFLEEMILDNLLEWIRFLDDLKNSESTNMIRTNSLGYNVKNVKEMVNNELNTFQLNRTEYINALLTKKKQHTLFSIPPFVQNNKIKNKQTIDIVRKEALPLFKVIQSKQKKLNKKNCKGRLKGPFNKALCFIRHPCKESLKNFAKSLRLARNVYKDADLFDRISSNYETFKNAPSIKTHIDHYINWETQRTNRSIPSFACIHVDDIHNPEIFFTYDTEDVGLIKSELADAESVINSLSNDYFGNISHDLSLRYIDSKVEYFYKQLNNAGLDKNTIVLICADHGFSFAGNPLRDSFVVNMFLENYHIPCIVSGYESKGCISKLCSSKDIPSILCYLADKSIPREFDGINPLTDEGYSFDTIEYCGGGCPDISRRDLKIGCFNKVFFVATYSKISSDADFSNVTEVYDLVNDPLQLRNLKNKKYDKEVVGLFLENINKRKKEIRSSLNESKS